jgi:hypothetical protein
MQGTTTQTVSQDVANQIFQRLDALAAKLGVTAQFIFGIYVQQARVEALRDTLLGLFLFALGLAFGYIGVRLIRFGQKENNYDGWPFLCGGLSYIPCLVAMVFAILAIYYAIGEWMNPQFWALDALFRAMHG